MVRPAFGVYIPLGFPDPETFSRLMESLRGCVDFIEVGIPSRKPKYDGPYIRRAHRLLAASTASSRNKAILPGGAWGLPV